MTMPKSVKHETGDKESLRTEEPISEKDEVKQAEDRTRKAAKSDSSVAAELKIRSGKK